MPSSSSSSLLWKDKTICDIPNAFPPLRYAFAYGSGVFRQPGLYRGHHNPMPMIDFIFVVDDPIEWHRQINSIAEKIGAGVYFNTLVPWKENVMIKYGVISSQRLKRDLIDWDDLYLAGRMHKPTHTLMYDASVTEHQCFNIQSALRVALLSLPHKFSLRELLHQICMLSYLGDFRMRFAEDSKKVDRIVKGSYEGLTKIYMPALVKSEEDWKIVTRINGNQQDASWYEQDVGFDGRAKLFASLPTSLLIKILHKAREIRLADSIKKENSLTNSGLGTQSRREAGKLLSQLPRSQTILRHCIAKTVNYSSKRQAVAGILSAGFLKSLRYGWEKIKKARNV